MRRGRFLCYNDPWPPSKSSSATPTCRSSKSWQAYFPGLPDVSVTCDNIFTLEADALVSPANSFGRMDGGLDAQIVEFLGEDIESEVQQLIRDRHDGELVVGQAEVVITQATQFPFLVVAPTMRVPQNVSRTVNAYLAFRAALRAVRAFNEQHGDIIQTLLVPGLGTDNGFMPPLRAARQMRAAYDQVMLGAAAQYGHLAGRRRGQRRQEQAAGERGEAADVTMTDQQDQFARALLAWYDVNKRDLPWRQRQHDPYAVWVSEIMLQQTTVAAVIPFYHKWMARFPTVQSLADAPLDDVLKHWAGLGYYARARNLHKGAQAVVAEHGGRVPSDPKTLLALPGIGRYTAGAILSIAFNQEAPILDANVIRVLSRVHAVTGDPKTSAQTQAELWRLAEEAIPQGQGRGLQPGDDGTGGADLRGGSAQVRLVPRQRRMPGAAAGRSDGLPAVRGRQEVAGRGGRVGRRSQRGRARFCWCSGHPS